MDSSSCVCSDTLLPLMRLTSSVNDMMKSEASDQSMANMSNAGDVFPPALRHLTTTCGNSRWQWRLPGLRQLAQAIEANVSVTPCGKYRQSVC